MRGGRCTPERNEKAFFLLRGETKSRAGAGKRSNTLIKVGQQQLLSQNATRCVPGLLAARRRGRARQPSRFGSPPRRMGCFSHWMPAPVATRGWVKHPGWVMNTSEPLESWAEGGCLAPARRSRQLCSGGSQMLRSQHGWKEMGGVRKCRKQTSNRTGLGRLGFAVP